MNLSPLLDGTVSVAAAVITAATPILVHKALSLMHVSLTATQEASLDKTLENALGEALKYGQAAGDAALSNVTIRNQAVSQALTFAMSDAAHEIKTLGYSPAEVGQLIANKLAAKLHTAGPASPEAAKTAAAIEKADAEVSKPVEPAPAPAPAA